MKTLKIISLAVLALLDLVTSAYAVDLTGNTITANGTYTVQTRQGYKYSFAAAGTFGSGSLAVQWRDANGNVGAYAESPAAAAENWNFTAATNLVDLVLTGATAPTITITMVPAEGQGNITNTIDGVEGLETALDDLQNSPSTIIMTVGDSIMRDRGLGFWAESLESLSIDFADATIIDNGVDFRKLEDLVPLLPAMLATTAVADRPAGTKLIVFIGTGYNDISNGESAADTLIHSQSCVNLVRAAGGTAVVLDCPNNALYAAACDSYSNLIREMAAAGNADFSVCLYRMDFGTSDNIHPNAVGAVDIAKEMLNVFAGKPRVTNESLLLPVKTTNAISAITVANPTVVVSAGHTLTTGQFIHITGSNSTPSINGIRQVTVLDGNNVSIPVNVTVAGNAGAINKGVIKLADDLLIQRQHTWLLNLYGENADSEVFLATTLAAFSAQVVLKLNSVGYLASNAGSVGSPVIGSDVVYTHPRADYWIYNNSTNYTQRIYKTLLGQSFP